MDTYKKDKSELINIPKPVFRWAGGKTWLLKHIDDLLPKSGFNNYHEPFLGGGAIYFHIGASKKIFLSDLNHELIESYIQIRDNVETVIRHLRRFENEKDFYYRVRDEMRFQSAASKAARFIYLNQTSFNGIYRVNLEGKYNVPFGYRTKDFLEIDKLRTASRYLNRVALKTQDFSKSLLNIKEGDLVFLDPPYTITHNNNGFFKYNKDLFTKNDQIRLAEYIQEIKVKGAFYIMTNAAHSEVKKIFTNGDLMFELSRASTVGGKKSKRGQYKEIVLTNTKTSL